MNILRSILRNLSVTPTFVDHVDQRRVREAFGDSSSLIQKSPVLRFNNYSFSPVFQNDTVVLFDGNSLVNYLTPEMFPRVRFIIINHKELYLKSN